MNPRVAILIPCYNEELTIGQVVRDFRQQLPEADIYVFDNNSTDRTVEIARDAGARIFFERRQGKGYVVQAMFRDVLSRRPDRSGTAQSSDAVDQLISGEFATELLGPMRPGQEATFTSEFVRRWFENRRQRFASTA